jgi:hypothetical protein
LLAWLQGRDEFPDLLRRHRANFGDLQPGIPWETFLAATEGRPEEARQILNGPEREVWRRTGAIFRHAITGLCAPLVAEFGDNGHIIAAYEDLFDYSGTWLVVQTNIYFGAADHHLGVLARRARTSRRSRRTPARRAGEL